MIRKPGSRQGFSPSKVQQLANRLRPYFAPASVLPPPGIPRGSTGNRNVSLTSGQSPNYSPTESTIVRLGSPNSTAARVTYNFKNKYKNPPVISHIVVGAYSGSSATPPEITLLGMIPRANNGVTIQSSAPDDTRFVHINIVGNPD